MVFPSVGVVATSLEFDTSDNLLYFQDTPAYRYKVIDACITQLKDQGPSRTCKESKEEEEDRYKVLVHPPTGVVAGRDGPDRLLACLTMYFTS